MDLATTMSSKALSKLLRKSRRMPNPIVLPPHNKGPEFGRQIFIYNHLQTNQVVYSLTRTLDNASALKQIPYNGKKTRPAALRKDHWAPFATIEFPSSVPDSGAYGLSTFHKLREYRKLHETLWPESLAWEESKDKDKKGEMVTLTRKARGRKLCDQKANSVADMAAALKLTTMRKLSQEEVAVERRAWKARAAERAKAREQAGNGAGAGRVDGEEEELKMYEPVVNARVKWANILDAEYAESWPETVVHDSWITGRMGRPLPADSLNYVPGGEVKQLSTQKV